MSASLTTLTCMTLRVLLLPRGRGTQEQGAACIRERDHLANEAKAAFQRTARGVAVQTPPAVPSKCAASGSEPGAAG